MEWFKHLYDDLRLRTTFGTIPKSRTIKEVKWLENVTNLHKGDRILDLFSGVGRHSIELAKRGHKITSIEYQKDYVEIAKRRAGKAKLNINFIQGDVRRVAFGSGYRACIVMYNSFGYFSDKEDFQILKKIASALTQGGYLILEILNRKYIEKNFTGIQRKDVGDLEIVETRNYDPAKRRVLSELIYYKRGKELARKMMSWRLYSYPEIRKLLVKAGLAVVGTYEHLKEKPIVGRVRLMQILSRKAKQKS